MNDKPTLFERIIDWLQSPVGLTVLAGLAGGVLRWITLKEKPLDGLTTAIAGVITSAYIGPVVAQMFGVTYEQTPETFVGICFMMGIGGISIAAIFISLFKDRDLLAAIKDAIIHFLTRGGGPRT